VTIRRSTSLWRGTDSGENNARILGLHCKASRHRSGSYPLEETIWAVGGRPGVLNWTLFEYPEPLCCFFTGCHGDKLWERDDKEFPDPFAIPSIALLGLGEFRLVKGIFHCPLPHWGVRHLRDILAIADQEEMKPWTLGRRGYDRPVARRIVEAAGVPRNAFARRKKNTSHEAEFLWPFSPGARERFAKYLRDRGCYVPGALSLRLIRFLAHAENLLHMNFLSKIGVQNRLRPWLRIAGRSLVFQWANADLRELYKDGLSVSQPRSTCGLATDNDCTEPTEISSDASAPHASSGDNRANDAVVMQRGPAGVSGLGEQTGNGRVFRLRPTVVPGWPKLAWVATMENGSHEIEVLCGPLVERGDNWIAEAVWAGDFEKGEFDQTDLVFGTGIRCRTNQDFATFVSSGSTLDRLVYRTQADRCLVSNSLGALLACADLKLRNDYDYSRDLRTICLGLASYTRSIPAYAGNIGLSYYNNLVWDGQSLREVAKPDSCPDVRNFSDYRQFLGHTSRQIIDNARDSARKQAVELLTSISSGYDSAAVAAVVSQVGCKRAATIGQSTSLWRGSDSGANIAAILGLECQSYRRTSRSFPHEESIWAAGGRPGVLNWTLFDYPEPLCCFFSGCHGDKLWERTTAELRDPFEIPSIADLGIGEFRLIKGIFHCPMPFWGIRHLRQIRAIGLQEEMKPWMLGTRGYDRPIARRIIEEAGIPRGAFAVRKKNTAHEAAFLWPYSPDAGERFAAYLSNQGLYAPRPLTLSLVRRIDHVENLLYMNLLRRLGLQSRLRPWERIAGARLIFHWANDELKQHYLEGMREMKDLTPLPIGAAAR
jgi:hypothetical protein